MNSFNLRRFAPGILLAALFPMLGSSMTIDFGTDPGKETYSSAGFSFVTENTGPTISDQSDAVRLGNPGGRLRSGIERTFSGLAVGDNNDFTISTTFNMVSNQNEQNNNRPFGIRLFGAAGDLQSGITARIENQGGTGGDELHIAEGQDSSILASTAFDLNGDLTGDEFGTEASGTNNSPYTFTVVGDYLVSGDLDLDFTVSDGTNSQVLEYTVTSAATNPLLAGDYFGLAGDSQSSGGIDAGFDFDTFSVTAIPEPSVFALFAVGMAMFGMKLRRS